MILTVTEGNCPPLPPFLASLFGVKPKEAKKEHITFLSKEEVASWNDLTALQKELNDKVAVLKAKTHIFWAQLELTYGVAGRNISIDRKTSALLADVKETE